MLNPFKKLLLVAGLCALPFTASQAQVDLSITVAPPVLRVYDQPPCPVDGYLWTPGYWAYGQDGYYWVDGLWIAPPRVGFLWTPGYWGFGDGFYAFHTGYWGPSVGFYGGVNYGYGYFGRGYGGGAWQGSVFRYNTAVTRVNTTVIHNTYVDNHVNQGVTNNRVSFNGRGGVMAKPTADERRVASAEHLPPTGEQASRREAASHDRSSFAPHQDHPQAGVVGKLPGGQGGTSQASRDAALANERHQGQEAAPRDAQRQQAREARQQAREQQAREPQAREPHAATQPREEARQAQVREAAPQRVPAASRREGQPQPQPQPQRAHPQGGEGHAPQQAPHQQHEGGGGQKPKGEPKGEPKPQ